MSKSTAEMIVEVSSFLLWHDPDDRMGGVTAEQAFASFCDLLGIPPGKITNIVRGPAEPDEVDD